MFETGFTVGLDHIPAAFNVRTKLVGAGRKNLEYIEKNTGATLTLIGKGSGETPNTRSIYGAPEKPLQVIVKHHDVKGLELAEQLVGSLIKSVREEFKDHLEKEYEDMESILKIDKGDPIGQGQGRALGFGGLQKPGQKPSNNQARFPGMQHQQHSFQNDSRRPQDTFNDSRGNQNQGHAQFGQQGRPPPLMQNEVAPVRTRVSRFDQPPQAASRNMPTGMPQQDTPMGNAFSRNSQSRYGSSRDERDSSSRDRGPRDSPPRGGSSRYAPFGGGSSRDNASRDDPGRGMPPRGGPSRDGPSHGGPGRNIPSRGASSRDGPSHGGPGRDTSSRGASSRDTRGAGSSASSETSVDLNNEKTQKQLSLLTNVLKQQLTRGYMQQLKARAMDRARNLQPNEVPVISHIPHTDRFCKLCNTHVASMQAHQWEQTHREMYLMMQLKLGIPKFSSLFHQVPLPDMDTDGGHQLAVSYVDAVIDSELLPADQEEAELYKEVLILSGFINKYYCGVCQKELNNLSGWLKHISSSKTHAEKSMEKPLLLPGQFTAAPSKEMISDMFEEKNKDNMHLDLPEQTCQQVKRDFSRVHQVQVGEGYLSQLQSKANEMAAQQNPNLRQPLIPTGSCKVCQTVMKHEHAYSREHREKSLELQLTLGIPNFQKLFGNIPIGVSDGQGRMTIQRGAKLAVIAEEFQGVEGMPEDPRTAEAFRQMVVLVGHLAGYTCVVCSKKFDIKGRAAWIQHVCSKEHARNAVMAMVRLGVQVYLQQHGNIIAPLPAVINKLLEKPVASSNQASDSGIQGLGNGGQDRHHTDARHSDVRNQNNSRWRQEDHQRDLGNRGRDRNQSRFDDGSPPRSHQDQRSSGRDRDQRGRQRSRSPHSGNANSNAMQQSGRERKRESRWGEPKAEVTPENGSNPGAGNLNVGQGLLGPVPGSANEAALSPTVQPPTSIQMAMGGPEQPAGIPPMMPHPGLPLMGPRMAMPMGGMMPPGMLPMMVPPGAMMAGAIPGLGIPRMVMMQPPMLMGMPGPRMMMGIPPMQPQQPQQQGGLSDAQLMLELQQLSGINDIGIISQCMELLHSLTPEVMEVLVNSSPEDYARALPQIMQQVPDQDKMGVLDILSSLNPQVLSYMMGTPSSEPMPDMQQQQQQQQPPSMPGGAPNSAHLMRQIQTLTGIADIGCITQAMDLLMSIPGDMMRTLVSSSPEQYAMAIPQLMRQVPNEDRQAVREVLSALSPQSLAHLMTG